MGGVGICCPNGSNGKFLSRWVEWEFAVKMGVMGSFSPNGSNGKVLSRRVEWEFAVQMGVMGNDCTVQNTPKRFLINTKTNIHR